MLRYRVDAADASSNDADVEALITGVSVKIATAEVLVEDLRFVSFDYILSSCNLLL